MISFYLLNKDTLMKRYNNHKSLDAAIKSMMASNTSTVLDFDFLNDVPRSFEGKTLCGYFFASYLYGVNVLKMPQMVDIQVKPVKEAISDMRRFADFNHGIEWGYNHLQDEYTSCVPKNLMGREETFKLHVMAICDAIDNADNEYYRNHYNTHHFVMAKNVKY